MTTQPRPRRPYVPDYEELASCYTQHMVEGAGEPDSVARADAFRGIARIEADALREAADTFAESDNRVASALRELADRRDPWLGNRAR